MTNKPKTIRVPDDLWKAFVSTCKDKDTDASRELRAFMRDYLKRNGQKEFQL